MKKSMTWLLRFNPSTCPTARIFSGEVGFTKSR
jgi:hypothetical protein